MTTSESKYMATASFNAPIEDSESLRSGRPPRRTRRAAIWQSTLACESMRLTFDADQWHQTGDLACQSGRLGGIDHRRHVLVGAGRFFGDAALGRTADQDAAARQFVHHLLALPDLRRRVSTHGTARAMAGRSECQRTGGGGTLFKMLPAVCHVNQKHVARTR